MSKQFTREDLEQYICEVMEIEAITPMIAKQINRLVLEKGMTWKEIARCICWYTEVNNKKLSIIYGISIVENFRIETAKYFKKLELDQQEQLRQAKKVVEYQDNNIIFNIKNLDLTKEISIGQKLYMKDPKYPGSVKYSVLTMRNSGTKNNPKGSGADLYISGKARLVLGSGESSEFLYNNYILGNVDNISKESLFLTSDSWMRFYITATDKDNLRYIELSKQGSASSQKSPPAPCLRPDTPDTGYLGTTKCRWRRVYSKEIEVTDSVTAKSVTTSGNVSAGSVSVGANGSIKIGTTNVSLNGHTHDDRYAFSTHPHDYAPLKHNHDIDYVQNDKLVSSVKGIIKEYVKSSALQGDI